MGVFRFALQVLLDERSRMEERAQERFLRARRAYGEVCGKSDELKADTLACDPSAFLVLDALERASLARREEIEEKRQVFEKARSDFTLARTARMQLTMLRERAYRSFQEREEAREALELDEGNRRSKVP